LPPHHGIKTPDLSLDKIHLVKPEESIDLPHSPFEKVALMSNSFAFGGNNVSLILGTNAPLKEIQ